jgi:hypothetical protein
MPSTPPHIEIPAKLRALLAHGEPDLLQRVEHFLETSPRTCTYVTSERVAAHPLRRNPLVRALGGKITGPTLGPLESKFGGVPSATRAIHGRGSRFSGR